jgi:hypothetical protein
MNFYYRSSWTMLTHICVGSAVSINGRSQRYVMTWRQGIEYCARGLSICGGRQKEMATLRMMGSGSILTAYEVRILRRRGERWSMR